MTKKRPKPCCHAEPCAELDSVSFQHLVKVFSAFGRHTFHPRPQDGVFRCNLNKDLPPPSSIQLLPLSSHPASSFKVLTSEEAAQDPSANKLTEKFSQRDRFIKLRSYRSAFSFNPHSLLTAGRRNPNSVFRYGQLFYG
jgi:hypothetical protein